MSVGKKQSERNTYAFCPFPSITPLPVRDRILSPSIFLILIIAVCPSQMSVDELNFKRPSTWKSQPTHSAKSSGLFK